MFVGYVQKGKLVALYPIERVEAYHTSHKISWAHKDHPARDCSYDEFMKKVHTNIQTGCVAFICTHTHASHALCTLYAFVPLYLRLRG